MTAAGDGRLSTLEAQGFDELLDFLKHARGFDFTGYKRASLQRRVGKRMGTVHVASYPDYLEYLEVHPDEYAELFDTILINVTSFFRDGAAWEYLDEEVLPELLRAKGGGGDIRVWSAGCASGQEAYSIAMLLMKHMGAGAFRERVRIYATDVDEVALRQARQARYPAKDLAEAPRDLVGECFQRLGGELAFRKDLRRVLIFGRNDLVQDAPISRVDLLLCRNTLMYFTAETQARILSRFNFALDDRGFLLLGKSEMLLTHGDMFTPMHLKCRVFRKVPRQTLRDRLALSGAPSQPARPAPADPLRRLQHEAFDRARVSELVVDRLGTLVAVNGQARALFGIAPPDVGRPLRDLEVSYRPVELRSAIESAYAGNAAVDLGVADWTAAGDARRLEVSVAPLTDESGETLGASVTFLDVTHHERLRAELELSKRELEVVYEELQSTVEELETTNEELQSTNEELQTTNEELQSTNEELETINDELRSQSGKLNDANYFLEGVLTSLGVGVAVIDATQVVRIWNEEAHDLWGLGASEAVGQHLLSLDIGLPLDRLRSPLRTALSTGSRPAPVVLEATNRRGRAIGCQVTAVPLSGDGNGTSRGAVVLMKELPPAGATAARDARDGRG